MVTLVFQRILYAPSVYLGGAREMNLKSQLINVDSKRSFCGDFQRSQVRGATKTSLLRI